MQRAEGFFTLYRRLRLAGLSKDTLRFLMNEGI